MTPPLALTLTGSLADVGAALAIAAVVGVALLSLLIFSQARELRRLREWSENAAQREAALEQRAVAAAAARAQSGVARPATTTQVPRVPPPIAPGAVGGQPPTPAVPPPLVRPATTAAPQPATAAASATGPQPVVPSSAPLVVPSTAEKQVVAPDAPQGAPSVQPAVAANAAPAAAPASKTAVPPVVATAAAPRPPATPPVAPPSPATASPTPAVAASAGATAAVAAGASAAAAQGLETAAPAKVDAKTEIVRPAAAAPAAAAPASSAVASTGAPVRPVIPPAPASGTRRPPPSDPPPPIRTDPPRRGSGEKPPKGRSRLVVGVIVLVAVAVAVAVVALGHKSTPSLVASSHTPPAHHVTHHRVVVVSPSNVSVAVLNATEVTGLAHRTAEKLQGDGFTQAVALAGTPPGNGQTSVVEYRGGSAAQARAVAKALSVSTVQPLEATVTPLVGTADVVVIVGQDMASEAAP